MQTVSLKSKILLISLIAIGAGVIAMLQTKDAVFDRPEAPKRGKAVPAPDFILPDLDGKMVRLADFKGKVVLLNVWATWCLPCVEEMPSMEKLHQQLKDENFILLAVSVDETGARAVMPFMKKHKLSFTALIDVKGVVKSLYQTAGVPESFIIDRQGRILEKVIGARNWSTPAVVDYFRNLAQ